MKNQKYPIIFCGAGPGDPELITVKGMKVLAEADLVLYAGSLVPEAVLNWAPEAAQRISSADMDLDQIVACLVEVRDQGHRVVRLHTGDPSLYGAIREQMAALRERNIPYEVIPGVSAAFAAAAALGIEYTVPERDPDPDPDPRGRSYAGARERKPGGFGAARCLHGDLSEHVPGQGGGAGCSLPPTAPAPGAPWPSGSAIPRKRSFSPGPTSWPRTARDLGIDRLAVILVGPALGRHGGSGCTEVQTLRQGFHSWLPAQRIGSPCGP